MFNFDLIGVSPESSYPNDEAYAEAAKLASRKEKFNCRFGVSNGYPIVMIETKTTSSFMLQLNEAILIWLINYLLKGDGTLSNIDTKVEKPAEEIDTNTFRKQMLMSICNQKLARSVQFTPEFRERTTGKVSAIANFAFGTIYFYLDRDEEMKSWLSERESLGE